MIAVEESKGRENKMQIVICSLFRRTLDRLKHTGTVAKDLVFFLEAGLNENTGPQIISRTPRTLPDYERILVIMATIKKFSKPEYETLLRNLFQDDEIYVEGKEE